MKYRNTLLLLIVSIVSFAQGYKMPALTTKTIHDKQLGTFNYYIASNNTKQKKPVLLFLEGSGCLPMLCIVNDGQNCCIYVNSFSINIDSLAAYYHVVLVSKPGVPLRDSINVASYDQFNLNSLTCSETYTKELSLEWRAKSASLALTKALSEVNADRKKVVAMGNSEGGQVVPVVAVLNKAVTHCINICGSGINQFYTPIIKTRMQARAGKISYEEAERQVDSLFIIYKDIYSNKTATNKSWFGQTYKRWSSFTTTPPIEQYKQLSIPVYIAIGAKDENGDVLSSDYVKLEFLRLGKINLTYKVYPTYDHFFNEITTDNGVHKKKAHGPEVYNAALQWAASIK